MRRIVKNAMSRNKSLKINIFFNMLKALMHIIFPLISFPYAARVLGVDNIGKVQYCNSIVSYFILFAGLGIANYATREGTKYRGNRSELSKFAKEVLSINIISTVISYGVLFVVAEAFLRDYLSLLIICSFLIAFTTFSIDWIYQIEEDFVYISIRTIAIQFLSLIALFLFVKKADDYIIYTAITVVANGGNCIFNWVHSRKYVDWFDKPEKLDYKQHIKPILLIFSISISASIYLHLDSVMVGAMRGDHEVGLYSAATKLVTVVKSVITSISAVLLSRLSFYAHKNDELKYKTLLKNSINCVLMVAMPCGIGLAILRKEILLLFCGKEFMDAAFASLILSINLIFSVIDGMLYNQVFLPLKLERQASIATIAGAIISFVLNYFFILKWGFSGAAVTTLISECVVFIILSSFASRRVNIRELFENSYQYIAGVGAIVIISIINDLLISNSYIKILTTVCFSIAGYFIILWMFRNKYLLSFHESTKRFMARK